jgi:hypothetical protein
MMLPLWLGCQVSHLAVRAFVTGRVNQVTHQSEIKNRAVSLGSNPAPPLLTV